jgi:hypothetical protein
MPVIDYQTRLIAKDKAVSANTVYSDETDIRRNLGFYIGSKVTTASTGSTWLEVADVDKTIWSLVPDSTKAISGNTDYAVDMSYIQGAFIRQAVQLVSTGTFTTTLSSKVI